MAWNNSGEDKLEFRQIVLKHLSKILEISVHELKQNSRQVVQSNYSETVSEEDTRKSYTQAIENLAIILIPYYDEKMTESYKKCNPIIAGYNFEIKKKLPEEFKELMDNKPAELSESDVIAILKIKYAKMLFVALNQLLKRQEYLKHNLDLIARLVKM